MNKGLVQMTFHDGYVLTFWLENWPYWSAYWPGVANISIDWQ